MRLPAIAVNHSLYAVVLQCYGTILQRRVRCQLQLESFEFAQGVRTNRAGAAMIHKLLVAVAPAEAVEWGNPNYSSGREVPGALQGGLII